MLANHFESSTQTDCTFQRTAGRPYWTRCSLRRWLPATLRWSVPLSAEDSTTEPSAHQKT